MLSELLLLLSILSSTVAIASPLHIPLAKRSSKFNNLDGILAAADRVRAKYGYQPHTPKNKRQSVQGLPVANQVLFIP